jgi:hypothetical protein
MKLNGHQSTNAKATEVRGILRPIAKDTKTRLKVYPGAFGEVIVDAGNRYGISMDFVEAAIPALAGAGYYGVGGDLTEVLANARASEGKSRVYLWLEKATTCE